MVETEGKKPEYSARVGATKEVDQKRRGLWEEGDGEKGVSEHL